MKNIEMKKMGKAAMAMALAGTFTFSPTFASADTLTEGQKVQADSSAAATVQVQEDTAKPELIPGDFFYFIKIALEKIKLAITFDKEKEANLLAGYAAERLAEAEELFNAGKEDAAVKTLQDGIAYLNEYNAKAEETTSAEQESEETKAEEQKTDEPKAKSAEQQAETDGEMAKDQLAEEEKAVEKDEDKAESSEDLVRNNIIALKAALEKVKNPTARAALQKNIDKTLAKIAEKAEKEATKEDKLAAGNTAEETEMTDETTKPIETEKGVSAEAEVTAKEETTAERPAVKAVPAVPATPAVPASSVKQEAKQKAKDIRQQANQSAKETRKQAHHEAKEVRTQAKQQAKEVKQAGKVVKVEAKAQVNVEKEENGKAADKGKNGN
ncbi:DUF5667 domain-containing protein [Bacillus sp. FJAT-27245]|uniref:DUF5667 domain-containing protein n=1 Tax=Bacillus sp. FJAT-27245 TaxID=1684144 RepID=UPI0006A75982|nr:DUF5667 domain-containing protein [Bacillus sp. FJAT-27245]